MRIPFALSRWRPRLWRAGLLGGLTTIAVGLGGTASAATPGVDPGSVDQHANQATSFTVNKTVHTPEIPPNPDVVLLVDNTGSMGGAIANVQANLHQVVTDVKAAAPTAQFAVASYKDTEGCDPDAFVVEQNLTAVEADVQAAVNTYSASGGCDFPEDWINALFQVSTGAIAYRTGSSRIVVLVGDAPSHDPSNGHSLADAIGALNAASTRVIAVDVSALDSDGQATGAVNATGGQLVPVSSAGVSAAILSGLHNLDVTVAPVVTCDPGLSASFDHGPVTVPSGADATFVETVSVSATAPQGGTLHCTVDFQLNGAAAGPAFIETITVHVNDTTPPVVVVDDKTVEATGPAGAVVSYPATAHDNVDGDLTPSCAPPSGGTFPIGATTVTCTATDSSGNTGTDRATMRVVDTTPPVPSCAQTNNPSGGTTPPAKNEDGFFVLKAKDIADPSAVVYIIDSADTSVKFGPYPSGTKIKLVQAPGAPQNVKPGSGDIDYKVTLKGDALIVGADRYGNVSAPVTCLVPPPPK
ncbi:MAG: hypothetical protein V7603_6253 [Micromonosporaceae bacterium]